MKKIQKILCVSLAMVLFFSFGIPQSYLNQSSAQESSQQSGTYFNDHIYVLVNNEIENVLLEFNDNFMYTKSYNISKLTKTTNVIRKSYLLADLENIYFVTIENDYLIFDRLQLIQYGEENK